ncbi:MAG: cytochrome c3 family protein [Vicinamibacterales bacterium]
MRTVLGAVVLLFALTLGWSIVTNRDAYVLEQQVTYRPIQVEGDGYVSSNACRACHPAQYSAWHASFHRTMTQVATPDSVRADFNGVRVDAVAGNPIALERRGSEHWAEFADPDWRGANDARPRIARQIVMITGSHYQQVYWYRTDRNRVLGQLPAMYLIADRRWIPRDASLLHPRVEGGPPETGRWNAVCVNCHATNGKRRFEAPADAAATGVPSITADTRVAELGIACEACHGPAAEHVRLNGSPLRRYRQYLTGEVNSAIVQPQRLKPAVSSQVCGQCHAVWEHFDEAAERRANVDGLLYRPGDDLSKTRFVVQPTRNTDAPTMRAILQAYPGYLADSFWPDGMVRVSGREYNGLIDSPCFANATDESRTLSCFSCHTMHKTAEDARSLAAWADTHQVAAGKEGNGACLQCHASIGADLQRHTRHAAESTGSSCYNCHMPYTTYGLLRALRSHRISSPSVAESVATGRPNACNACHLDKTLAWTSDFLEKWYGTAPVRLTEDDRTVAASLLWLLRGDAGQRALAAWSMGWEPARATSGTSWLALPLAMLLNDPYDAVRYIAYRSLESLPGFDGFQYDFLAPPAERTAATLRALEHWPRTLRSFDRRTDSALLLDAAGAPRMDVIVRLGLERNDRPVVLRE